MSLNPVETSGARCEGPKRMHKKKLGSLRSEQLKCYGNDNTFFWESEHIKIAKYFWYCWHAICYICLHVVDDKITPSEVCPEDSDCPADCYCEGGTVDCAHRDLTEFPLDLPKTAKRLLLNDNKITRVPALGLFNRLPQLESVDLSRNRIEVIEEGAFEGANSILEM